MSILLLIAGVESNPGSSARNTQQSNFQFELFNVRSAVKKAASIHTLLAHDVLDVLALTETWICVDDPEAGKLDLAPSGYAGHHVPRTTGRGGGLAFLHRTPVNISPWKTCPATKEFESQFVKLTSPSRSVDLISIYRPPGPISSAFLDEFSDLLDIITTSDSGFLICSDVNCPGITTNRSTLSCWIHSHDTTYIST